MYFFNLFTEVETFVLQRLYGFLFFLHTCISINLFFSKKNEISAAVKNDINNT